MSIAQRRCKHCGKCIPFRPQNPNQKYCSQPECQKARKRQWQRQKLNNDHDYKKNQSDAAKRWVKKNPNYWRNYRAQHKAYTIRNREQQKRRNQRRKGSPKRTIANMDVSNPPKHINTGRYQLIPVTGGLIANMDASIVEISVIRDGYQ